MVYGVPKTKEEEKEFLKRHLKCYGSLDAPEYCNCPLMTECSLEVLKKLIDMIFKHEPKYWRRDDT